MRAHCVCVIGPAGFAVSPPWAGSPHQHQALWRPGNHCLSGFNSPRPTLLFIHAMCESYRVKSYCVRPLYAQTKKKYKHCFLFFSFFFFFCRNNIHSKTEFCLIFEKKKAQLLWTTQNINWFDITHMLACMTDLLSYLRVKSHKWVISSSIIKQAILCFWIQLKLTPAWYTTLSFSFLLQYFYMFLWYSEQS